VPSAIHQFTNSGCFTSSVLFASCVLRWKTHDSVLLGFGGRHGSDVQDQLRDLPRNQKMAHAGMLVQCHQHIGTGSIMLMGYRTTTATAPKHFLDVSPLLSLRHLLLLSPRKTWKKRFDNIFFSKFDSLAQGTTCINYNIKPSLHTVSYEFVRSINTTPVLSLR
jgi:hypothetical protein